MEWLWSEVCASIRGGQTGAEDHTARVSIRHAGHSRSPHPGDGLLKRDWASLADGLLCIDNLNRTESAVRARAARILLERSHDQQRATGKVRIGECSWCKSKPAAPDPKSLTSEKKRHARLTDDRVFSAPGQRDGRTRRAAVNGHSRKQLISFTAFSAPCRQKDRHRLRACQKGSAASGFAAWITRLNSP